MLPRLGVRDGLGYIGRGESAWRIRGQHRRRLAGQVIDALSRRRAAGQLLRSNGFFRWCPRPIPDDLPPAWRWKPRGAPAADAQAPSVALRFGLAPGKGR